MFAMLEHHRPAKDIYDDGKLFLDFSEQTASLNGKSLTLSPMEFKMLNLFRKNPKQVLTRGHLLEKLWDVDENYVDEHTLTTTIVFFENVPVFKGLRAATQRYLQFYRADQHLFKEVAP